MAAQTKGPGGKQPTINDVAALAGVSKKTVSRVINRSDQRSGKSLIISARTFASRPTR